MQKALCVLKYFCCLKEILVQLFALQTEQKVCLFLPISSACHQFWLEKQFTNYGYVDLGIFSFFSLFLEMDKVSLLLQGRLLTVFVDKIWFLGFGKWVSATSLTAFEDSSDKMDSDINKYEY